MGDEVIYSSAECGWCKHGERLHGCEKQLEGSFSLTLQLPMLKEAKRKTLVSRKDSAVTNNLPSNWTGDEEKANHLGLGFSAPIFLT
ncbi:hypothetical protein CEXT_97991 [Caerostris extrusa]|uniref:Uncharacterized protein n=1 Tax=Caerostris extrusa TaxID=172846 RepID=A0AAV4U8P5_CAEEX|nr:hypothetical protein CEXT_97991 [Caerostris extrusa]